MDGIDRMDLYRFFSSVRSARINKDAENKTVFPNTRLYSDVVLRGDNRVSICDMVGKDSTSRELFIKHTRDRVNAALQSIYERQGR